MKQNGNSLGISAEVKLVLDAYIHSKIIMAFNKSDQAIFGLAHYPNTDALPRHNNTQPTHCDQIHEGPNTLKA